MSDEKNQFSSTSHASQEVEIGILVPDRNVELSSDGHYLIFEDSQNWISPLKRYRKYLLDSLLTLKNDFFCNDGFTITTKGFLGIDEDMEAPASCRIILHSHDVGIEPDVIDLYEKLLMALAQRIAPQPSLEIQNYDEGFSEEIVNFMDEKSNEFRQAHGGTKTASGFTFMNNLTDRKTIYFNGAVPNTDMVQTERFEIDGIAKTTGFDVSENKITLTVLEGSLISGKQHFLYENPDLVIKLCHAKIENADVTFFGFAIDFHNGKGLKYHLTSLKIRDAKIEPLELK